MLVNQISLKETTTTNININQVHPNLSSLKDIKLLVYNDMSEAQIGSESNDFNGVSSSVIDITLLPNCSTTSSTSNNNSSSISSTNSSCESGDCTRSSLSLPVFVHPEYVSNHTDSTLARQQQQQKHLSVSTTLTTNRCSVIMSSQASLNASSTTQITPKMLNDINNMTDSIHKINQPHNQMIEQQQQKVHPSVIPLSEDPRTLQLALELSLVGLNDSQNSYVQPIPIHQSTNIQNDYEIGSINIVSASFAGTEIMHSAMNNLPLPPTNASGLLMPSAGLEDRSKKSQNMTECVPVPSSEHVAEIVGRQGCKIKALRAKTNTYIKTPVRGEEPVFVVTGRKEDVNKAKREILSAADHFSLIRASRKPSMESSNDGSNGGGGMSGNSNSGSSLTVGIVARTQSGPPCLPGQITIQVRVPYRVVGLVVGPKGATIKHIQQETQTYIVTPSREKEPIFEVTGLPENVDTARKQIEAHIALRTGNSTQGSENGGTESIDSNEFATLHTINTLTQILNDDLNSDILSSIYKSDISPNVVNYAENAVNVIDSVNSISNSTSSSILNLNPVRVHNLSSCFQTSDIIDIAPNNISNMQTTDKNFSLPISAAGGELNGNGQLSKSNYLFRNTHHKTVSVSGSCPSTSTTNAPSSQCHSISANNILTRSCSSASSTASTKSTNNSANSTNSSVNTPPELLNIWKNLNDSIDVDEGIGDSPSIWNLPATTAITVASNCSPTASISPTDSLLGEHSLKLNKINNSKEQPCPNSSSNTSSLLQHQQLQQQQQRPTVQNNSELKLHSLHSHSHAHSHSHSISHTLSHSHRECFVCNEREVTTALVPCGHNMFCMDCANQICVSMESICPICHSIVYHAMRILA